MPVRGQDTLAAEKRVVNERDVEKLLAVVVFTQRFLSKEHKTYWFNVSPITEPKQI